MTQPALSSPQLQQDHAHPASLPFVLLLAAWGAITFTTWRGEWANDLAALWFAAHFLAEGQQDLVYAAPARFFGGTAPEWQPYLDQFNTADTAGAFPYVYPPLWAGLLAPLTRMMSPQAFFDAVLAAHLAMMAGSVLLAERLVRPAAISYRAFMMWGVSVLAFSVPAISAVSLNQPTIAATFLILLAFTIMRRRPAWAGAALALAAALKLTPAAFVLLILARRQHRAAGAFALCGAGLALASLSFGWPLHAAFLAQLDAASRNAFWGLMNPSPRILLLLAVDHLGLVDPEGPGSAKMIVIDARGKYLVAMPAWLGKAAALTALAVALPAAWLTLTRKGREADALALLAMFTALFLFGPLSWQHYLLGPLLLAPALALALPLRLALPVLATVWFTSSVFWMLLTDAAAHRTLLATCVVSLTWSAVLALTLVAMARLPPLQNGRTTLPE